MECLQPENFLDPGRRRQRYSGIMKIISLNCNNCGGPLDVPVKARFVTCGFCNCRLEVQQTGNTFSTEVIEQLIQQTNQIQDDVEYLKRKAAIAELDEEWKSQKSKFTVRSKGGRVSVPTQTDAFIQGFLGIIFAIVTSFILGPIAILLGILLIAKVSVHAQKAVDYNAALKRYQKRRQKLTLQESTRQSIRP